MFIRRSFDEFPKLQSNVPQVPAATRDWTIDWRWLCDTEAERPAFPSERSLIDCAAWAKPKRRKPA